MKINIIIPKWYKDMNGFNENFAEQVGEFIKLNTNINVLYSIELPIKDCEMYIYITQYREEAFGDWISNSCKFCNRESIIGVAGKAATEARYFLLENIQSINFVVMGECEQTLSDIIRLYMENGLVSFDDWNSIQGIMFRYENICIETIKRKCILDYNTLPVPTFDYLNRGIKQYPICVLESSRGCHGNCKFCEGNINRLFNPGDTYRAKSAERVVDEIQYVYKKYNRRIFSFSDDNFFVDGKKGLERAKKIANELIKRNIKIRFTIECRIDDIDNDTIKCLKDAGLHKAFVGIESGSQSFLDRIGKNVNISIFKDRLSILHKNKVLCEPGYIFFDPLTNKEELADTVDFFEECMEYFYSPNFGKGDNSLFIPYDSPLLYEYWPDQTRNFYMKICNSISNFKNYKLEDALAEKIYNTYIYELKKMDRNENILAMRINCLKKAIKKYD